MSVVEKEVSRVDGLEGINGDLGAPLKVARSSLAVSNGKASRAVLYREPRAATPVEIRNFISARSDALQQFVAPLDEAIRKAARYRARSVATSCKAIGKVGELVLAIIRKISHRETGIYSLDPNVAPLLSILYAGSVEVSIVAGLVRRAQEALVAVSADESEGSLQQSSSGGGLIYDYDVARELDELGMLLKWYVKRKMSLTGLEVYQSRRSDALSETVAAFSSDEDDALFGFEVMHDHQVFGAKGCFVTCGLRLVGHDGQPLWLRVSVRCDGKGVAVRPEWSSWTDPGRAGEVQVLSEDLAFCSLVPIRPNAQRIIIDDIRAFVPYGALDLPPGRCDIELLISVIDNEGSEILTASRAESICVPHLELVNLNAPAPHAVGMWPHDVVSGDRLSELRISSGYKIVAGWERHSVSVQFDLSLFMHAGEGVLLECRFLDSRGNIVELSSLGIPYVASELNVAVESVSSYRYRRVLHPKGAWAYYRGLCIDIPVEFLLLEQGSHNLTCEVMVVSSDDRVLCGDMGIVTLQVSGREPQKNDNGGQGNVVESDLNLPRSNFPRSEALIDLQSIEIDPAWNFGNDECVRIQATFLPRDASRQIAELASGRVGELFTPYRVEVSLEREDGHLLLQAFSDLLGMGFKPVTRGVCVEGSTGFSAHSVVTNFKKDEILGWSLGLDGQRAFSKISLFARIRALSLSGEELLSQTREFFVKPTNSSGRQVVEVGGNAPRIVDVSATSQLSRIACRAVVNLPHGRPLEQGLMLIGTIKSPGKKGVEVFRQRLVSQQRAAWVRQQIGLCQLVFDFNQDLVEPMLEGLVLEVALLSPSNEVIQSVCQGVQSASILSDSVESVIADELVLGSQELNGVGNQQTRRGLFSWFKS